MILFYINYFKFVRFGKGCQMIFSFITLATAAQEV